MAEAKKRNKDKDEHTDHDYELFIELIQLMLTYEPADRVKPSEALAHPFLHGAVKCVGAKLRESVSLKCMLAHKL
eukprot:SAG31_NODE_1397_length_8506_cov_13.069585_5_plen_75_part_00